MAKGLTIASMVIAILVLVLFGLDLALQIPFRRASIMLDVVFVLCALGIGYISWATFREVR